MDQKSTQQILKILYKILAEGLPSSGGGGGGGDATAANQTTQITKLTSIDTETTAQGLTLDAIQTAVELIDNAISGNEMQVDLVGIGDVATATKQDELLAEIGVPNAVSNSSKNITTAGTAEALASSTTAIKYVIITAKAANTGNVYIGGSGVSSTNGHPLAAGESVTIWIDDLAEVYADVDTNGEWVVMTYGTRNEA